MSFFDCFLNLFIHVVFRFTSYRKSFKGQKLFPTFFGAAPIKWCHCKEGADKLGGVKGKGVFQLSVGNKCKPFGSAVEGRGEYGVTVKHLSHFPKMVASRGANDQNAVVL